jgi:hypothetical protein
MNARSPVLGSVAAIVTVMLSCQLSAASASRPLPVRSAIRAAYARSLGIDPSRVRLGAWLQAGNGAAVRLWIVRGRTSSDVCVSIQIDRGHELAGACGGTGAADSIGVWVGPVPEPGEPREPSAREVIGGIAARAAAHVRLWFAGRRTLLVPARSGAWVAEIRAVPRAGRGRLMRIDALDRDDRIIATRELAP